MKKAGLLLFLLSVHFLIISGQVGNRGVDPLLFRGVVMDASTLERLANTNIIINRAFTSLSGGDGTFSFLVYRSDTVIFRLLGYKQETLVISDTLSANEFIAGVYLENDTLAIGEVIILPKIANLKADIMNVRMAPNTQNDNARNNISVASYQGRTGQDKLGDPRINYEVLRQKQKTTAYEKGGIPSDRILGLSPLLLIPAAYLLFHGVPEKPPLPKSEITSKELDDLNNRYIDLVKRKK